MFTILFVLKTLIIICYNDSMKFIIWSTDIYCFDFLIKRNGYFYNWISFRKRSLCKLLCKTLGVWRHFNPEWPVSPLKQTYIFSTNFNFMSVNPLTPLRCLLALFSPFVVSPSNSKASSCIPWMSHSTLLMSHRLSWPSECTCSPVGGSTSPGPRLYIDTIPEGPEDHQSFTFLCSSSFPLIPCLVRVDQVQNTAKFGYFLFLLSGRWKKQ